ncbi:transferase family protein [Cercophora scortea]|uniref:Transferase family protein n=1 Tax=Cercophora scortea TaxID=314031 RepID=A0AAE0IWW5_9PEZI|nr:transferase family protein [Cercophora scortea]
MPRAEISISQTERVFPSTQATTERCVPLSLLDATTANFSLTNAVWLFERPTSLPKSVSLVPHLRHCLRATLDSYPQWAGQCKAIHTLDGKTDNEAQTLPSHARRFGRLYAHFGTGEDPGVELITATSSATLDFLYPAARTATNPLWNRQEAALDAFSPGTTVTMASPLQQHDLDTSGLRKPLLAIQLTELACGGFVLAAQIVHPMADIAALVHFVKSWGSVSRSRLRDEALPMLDPVFNPAQLDDLAAADINAGEPDEVTLDRDRALPMHRFDWWAPVAGRPPPRIPTAFGIGIPPPSGSVMPWADWDVKAPVSSYIVHLSRQQVEVLWQAATSHGQADDPGLRISKHDAVLAHIWSSITRARGFDGDSSPVHCDLTIGVRPAMQLGDAFIGSPIVLINIEMSGAQVAGRDPLQPIAKRIRETIVKAINKESLAAHLHGVAFEKSPQRIWQAFLGQRHILVTTWARAGIYKIDFGFRAENLGSCVRYADGVVPDMDGIVLIKEAPPILASATSDSKPTWTDNGVDISVYLRAHDMERFLKDSALLPVCKYEASAFKLQAKSNLDS